MNTPIVIGIVLLITIPIAIVWANAFNKKQKNYRGEDFLHSAGRDHWDDWDENKVHTEAEF
jgi:hypothetical protein